MTPKQFEEWLHNWLSDTAPITRISTFEEAGILTRNRGLVFAFEDGAEIQMTLVQSRRGADGDE